MSTLKAKTKNNFIDSLKEKAKNGFQMVRLPRCGTTATLMAMQQLLPEEKFVNLGEGCFSDMPFSWGPWHNKLVNFSDTAHYKLVYYTGAKVNSDGRGGIEFGGGAIQTTSAINNIKFTFSSGNITAGTFNLYGID